MGGFRNRAALGAAALLVLSTACSSSSRTRAAAPTSTGVVPTSQPSQRPVPGVEPGGIYSHTGPGNLSPAVAGVPNRVYVPNSTANTVDVIDPATFAVVDHFPTGRLPQHVTPAWDLKTLYVDNDEGNSLTPIDPRTGQHGVPIPVEDPYNLYFTPDGTKAVVVAERLKRLDVRDAHTFKLLGSIPVPFPGVDHADFTADGTAMVLSCEFSGWVVKVDVTHMTLTEKVRVGGQPIDVKLSPDGRFFYVANQSRGGVSILDANTLQEVNFIRTGKGAHGLYPSRDATSLYVTNRGEGSVSVVAFSSRKVVATWRIGGSPDMGGVSIDGTQLWLSGRYNSAVYVIDTRSGQLLHRIAVGAGAHGLCVFPQPGRYSLGHTGNLR